MKILQNIAFFIIGSYFLIIILLYIIQTRMIFFPGKLARNYKFKTSAGSTEVFLQTGDGETINGIFRRAPGKDVILYFHGNAGDLSGWHFVAEDFSQTDHSTLIIDYRGYGKSTGSISEKGFYEDAEAAYQFLLKEDFHDENIIIYGRSIGCGVAVELARRHVVKGLVLESAFTSLTDLADEKLPFFFPSVYLRFSFNNLKKINMVRSPVIFIHGSTDSLIPSAHCKELYKRFTGKKKLILIEGGSHNDLNAFPEYNRFVAGDLTGFFH